MNNEYPRYTLRVSNELLFKVGCIADFYGRTKNREIEHTIKKHIDAFEKTYGEITLPKELIED